MLQDRSSMTQKGPFKPGSTWLCGEAVDEAIWRCAKPAMHLIIPQHSKAARRNRVPSNLRIATKTASSMCKGQLKII